MWSAAHTQRHAAMVLPRYDPPCGACLTFLRAEGGALAGTSSVSLQSCDRSVEQNPGVPACTGQEEEQVE